MVFAAVVIAAYTGVRHRRAAVPFFLGALTAVIALGAYHHALFGRAWDTPFSHLENPEFARLHNDVPLAGLGRPRPRPLLNMLFAPDIGLFVFSPFLLIGLLGAVVAVVRGTREVRLEGVTILLVFVSMALFASGVPNWHAGWCVGPRYIAVVVPFLGWGIVLLHRLGYLGRRVRSLLGGTVLVSVVLCGVSAAVYPHYPEQFDNPVFDLAFPLLGDGHVPYSVGHLIGLHGLVSLAPLAAALLVPLAIGLAGDDPRPSVWLSATGGAIGVALLLLISLGAYGAGRGRRRRTPPRSCGRPGSRRPCPPDSRNSGKEFYASGCGCAVQARTRPGKNCRCRAGWFVAWVDPRKEPIMKILALYTPEKSNPPTPEMMAKMNAFIEELTKAGKLIATEGRKAGAPGMKIRMRQGQLSVTDGPFTEAKELVGGFALMNVDSREEIVTLTRRFLEIAGDGESEIIEMFEAPAQHG